MWILLDRLVLWLVEMTRRAIAVVVFFLLFLSLLLCARAMCGVVVHVNVLSLLFCVLCICCVCGTRL